MPLEYHGSASKDDIRELTKMITEKVTATLIKQLEQQKGRLGY